jgi:general secretion pathway protein D
VVTKAEQKSPLPPSAVKGASPAMTEISEVKDKGAASNTETKSEVVSGESKDEIFIHISGAITNLKKDIKKEESVSPLPDNEKASSAKDTAQPQQQQPAQPAVSETQFRQPAILSETTSVLHKNHISGSVTPLEITPRKNYLAINVDDTNLREGPGVEFSIKGTAKKGERLEFAETTDTVYLGSPWYKVRDNKGNEVYVWGGSVLILKEGEPPMPKAETDTLYLSNKRIAGEKQGFVSPPKEIESRTVVLNFENTDINDIISTIGELLGLDYIIEAGVAGKVTIRTSGKIPANELFAVLEQILEINNLTVVKTGRYYRFMPAAEAKRKPLETFMGRDGSALPPSDRVIIQLIPVKYLPVESVKGVLAPLLTKNGSLFDIPNTQTLGLIDISSNVKRLLEIVDALDINALERMYVRLFPIKYASVAEINRELINIFSSLGIKEKEQFLKFVPIQRINSILMVSLSSEMTQTAEKWIEKLDKPVIEGNAGAYVYYVQNGDAANIADIITSLYGVKKKAAVAASPKAGETPAVKLIEPPKAAEPPRIPVTSVEILGAAEVEGEVTVISDKDTNAIIVRTSPQNYPAILETIKRLDKVATQVMIEIMVAELTLDEKTQFGLEWAIKTGSGGFGVDTGSSLAGSIGASGGQLSALGLNAFVRETDKLIGLFQAYAADSKFNVLLSPMILTSENKPSTINIANEVPIETTTFLQTGTTPVTTRSYQYKSIGTKLTVTPKINEQRMVTLDINQEVSQVNEAAQSSTTPSFFTRQVQTTVVVSDKQSLIIGGLIEDKKDNTRSGIPWLYKLPVIGWLFGAQKDVKKKTELVMLITPHIIANSSEAKAVTEEFQSRLESLQKTLVFGR